MVELKPAALHTALGHVQERQYSSVH